MLTDMMQVIVERAEKSDVPEIDKKKLVSFHISVLWAAPWIIIIIINCTMLYANY